jgi:hypothetical protein
VGHHGDIILYFSSPKMILNLNMSLNLVKI